MWKALERAGVGHLRTRPYRPQSNGKVERLNHTINLEGAYAGVDAGNQARLDALPGWVHAYNHHRPHTALGGRSPCKPSTTSPGTTPSSLP
jgi:transposase InsO family protein